MGYIEVDQSGKIEQFDKDTVVALCNDREYSVLIPKRVKQEVFFRHKGKIRDLKYKLFSISLFYCLKNFVSEERKTVICAEYTGKDRFLKSELNNLFKLDQIAIDNNVLLFSIITKNSPAHKLALSVFRRLRKPDLILSKEHIEKLLK